MTGGYVRVKSRSVATCATIARAPRKLSRLGTPHVRWASNRSMLIREDGRSNPSTRPRRAFSSASWSWEPKVSKWYLSPCAARSMPRMISVKNSPYRSGSKAASVCNLAGLQAACGIIGRTVERPSGPLPALTRSLSDLPLPGEDPRYGSHGHVGPLCYVPHLCILRVIKRSSASIGVLQGEAAIRRFPTARCNCLL